MDSHRSPEIVALRGPAQTGVADRVPAVELAGITRRFGRRWVLRGVDLTVRRGDVVALIGRNGSGKTTLLRILTTGLRPNHGTGRIFGAELVRQAGEVRQHVGLLAHNAGIYEDLTALENLQFALRMLGQPADAAVALEALDAVGLGREAGERARGFSSGMRRRLALARVMLRAPELLLLDEPFASFDEDGIERLTRFILAVRARGGAAIIATHDLRRARAVLTRVVEIREGHLYERPDAAVEPRRLPELLYAEEAD